MINMKSLVIPLRKLLAVACAISLLLASLSICGCASQTSVISPKQSASKQASSGPLKIAVQYNALSIPTVFADEKGYFEEQGLDVELFTFVNGAEENKAVENGDVEVASDGLASVYILATGQFSWIGESDVASSTVAIYIKEDAPAAKVSGEIPESPDVLGSEDTLRDLSVVGPAGTMEEWAAISYFSKFGLSPGTDFEFIEMDREDAVDSVIAGDADIFVATDADYCRVMEDNGFVALAKGEEATRVSFNNGYLVSNKAIEDRHDELVKFLIAVYKAAEVLDNDHDLWANYAYEYYRANGKPATKKDVRQEVGLRTFLVPSDFTKPDYRLGTGVLDVGRFNAEIGALEESQVEAIEQSIDTKLLEEAFGIKVQAASLDNEH